MVTKMSHVSVYSHCFPSVYNMSTSQRHSLLKVTEINPNGFMYLLSPRIFITVIVSIRNQNTSVQMSLLPFLTSHVMLGKFLKPFSAFIISSVKCKLTLLWVLNERTHLLAYSEYSSMLTKC